jgi:hypothetical protein
MTCSSCAAETTRRLLRGLYVHLLMPLLLSQLPSTQEELRGLGIEGDSLSPELVLAWIDGANPKSSAKSPPAVFTLMQKRVWHSARVALKRVRGKLRQRKSRGSHSAPKPPPQHPQSSSPLHKPGQEAMPSCPTPLTPQHHSTR